MKPIEPGPDDNFILRVNGEMRRCEECGANLFHRLLPRDGVDRYGCNGCDAAYLLVNAEAPKLLEN